MSGKPKPIPQLTKEHWRELKWFSKNVVGTRQEFYSAIEQIEKFKNKIDRLYDEAKAIEKFCKEHNINMIGEKVGE